MLKSDHSKWKIPPKFLIPLDSLVFPSIQIVQEQTLSSTLPKSSHFNSLPSLVTHSLFLSLVLFISILSLSFSLPLSITYSLFLSPAHPSTLFLFQPLSFSFYSKLSLSSSIENCLCFVYPLSLFFSIPTSWRCVENHHRRKKRKVFHLSLIDRLKKDEPKKNFPAF